MANLGRGLLGRLIGGVLSLAIAGGAYFLFFVGQEKVEEAKAPKVGECVNVTGSSMNADHDEIDCGDAKATFKIVSNKGNCDEAEQNYTISLGTTDSGNVADLCLALNAAKGDCFDLGSMATAPTKVACAGAGSSVVKVVSVGKAGDTCANGAQPLENKLRKTLLCLGPVV